MNKYNGGKDCTYFNCIPAETVVWKDKTPEIADLNMENLTIEKTGYTPYVNFNSEDGIMEISGVSSPEDSVKFYQPLVKWLEDYSETGADHATLIFKMEYFNTSSTVFLLRIMRTVVKMKECGKMVNIQWYHKTNDDDMIEAGQEFSILAKFPIELFRN
jgi:hypothetical protein